MKTKRIPQCIYSLIYKDTTHFVACLICIYFFYNGTVYVNGHGGNIVCAGLRASQEYCTLQCHGYCVKAPNQFHTHAYTCLFPSHIIIQSLWSYKWEHKCLSSPYFPSFWFPYFLYFSMQMCENLNNSDTYLWIQHIVNIFIPLWYKKFHPRPYRGLLGG